MLAIHRLKIQGRGYGMFLPKFLGGSRISGKIARGVHLFCILLHFYYQVFRKFAWGVLFHTPSPLPHLPPPPVCIYVAIILNNLAIWHSGNLYKFDHINQMITLSEITLCGFHCIIFNCISWERGREGERLPLYNIKLY